MEERVLADLLGDLEDLEDMTDIELDVGLSAANADPYYIQSVLEKAAERFGYAFTRQRIRLNSIPGTD